jgi:hypothetical protein
MLAHGKVRDFIALKRPVAKGRSEVESTHWSAVLVPQAQIGQ